MEESDYSVLKTFLTYLNVMPDEVKLIRGKNIINSDIPVVEEIVDSLRDL